MMMMISWAFVVRSNFDRGYFISIFVYMRALGKDYIIIKVSKIGWKHKVRNQIQPNQLYAEGFKYYGLGLEGLII